MIDLGVFRIVQRSEYYNVPDPFPGYNLGIGCKVMYLESVLSILLGTGANVQAGLLVNFAVTVIVLVKL